MKGVVRKHHLGERLPKTTATISGGILGILFLFAYIFLPSDLYIKIRVKSLKTLIIITKKIHLEQDDKMSV